MKKNLFFILVILVLITVVSIAALCNQCSISTEDETTGTQVPSGSDASEGQTQTSQAQNQTDSQDGSGSSDGTDESGETTGEGGDETEGTTEDATGIAGENSSPVIESVICNVGEATIDASEGLVRIGINPGGAEFNVRVYATDEDGDELSYTAVADEGTISEVRKLDNNNAEFFWISPEVGSRSIISIEVLDGKGGNHIKEITVETLVIEWMEEEPTGESLRGIGADNRLSGYIVADTAVNIAGDASGAPSIFVGDTATIKQSKGYLSFDISDLAGETVIQAWLTINNIEHAGDPSSLTSDFLIYAFDYGPSLEMADYRTGGTRLDNFGPGTVNLEVSNDALSDAVQRSIDSGNDFFQLKLAFTNENGNGQSDGFIIYMSDVILEVSYR